MRQPAGHVFVVQGRLESVVHDVAVVPTSDRFQCPRLLERPGRASASPTQAGWLEGAGFRTKPAADPRLWFVSVELQSRRLEAGDRSSGAVWDRSIRGHRRPRRRAGRQSGQATDRIAQSSASAAVGWERRRGEVTRMSTGRCARELRSESRRRHRDRHSGSRCATLLPNTCDARLRSASELGPVARTSWLRRVGWGRWPARPAGAVPGSRGFSSPAGLPSWDGCSARRSSPTVDLDASGVHLVRTGPGPAHRTPYRAEASWASNVSRTSCNEPRGRRLAARPAGQPGLSRGRHHQLRPLSTSKPYAQPDREIKAVMPWNSAHGADRWILKLHGDVDHVKPDRPHAPAHGPGTTQPTVRRRRCSSPFS